MGGNMMKHLDRLIQLISLPIHGRGTQVHEKRKLTLAIISACIKSCWPVMCAYENVVLKLVLRLLVDACTAASFVKGDGRGEVMKELEDAVYNVLLLMHQCSRSEVS